ncbi:MAG: hypothetical protein ACE5JU_21140 [Candidatus Binatia bacterium]
MSIQPKDIPRDYVNQIISRGARLRSATSRFNSFRHRYDSLRQALSCLGTTQFPDPVRTEFLRHFPVAIIAALEGYLRLVIRDLIDSGPPFITNARKFKDIKFDMTVVEAIGRSTISLGDFVSQVLPLKNIESITNTFTTLLGNDLWHCLNAVELSVPLHISNQTIATFEPLSEIVRRELHQLFARRNVLAHELALPEKPSPTDAKVFFLVVVLLVGAIEDLTRKLAKPNIPPPGLKSKP